jgi:membrane-associated protein
VHNDLALADSIFQTLSDFFARYGYWTVFFGVMLENAGLPVPGETVLLFAGFLSYQGEVRLWRAIATGFAGAVLGDSGGYFLGRFAGTPFVAKYVRRFSVLSRQFSRAQDRFQKHGHWAVLVGRFITGLRVFAGPLAGMLRMPYPRFLIFNVAGAVLWATTIACVGFLFGSNWERLVGFIKEFNRLTLAVGALIAFVVMIIHFRRKVRRT